VGQNICIDRKKRRRDAEQTKKKTKKKSMELVKTQKAPDPLVISNKGVHLQATRVHACVERKPSKNLDADGGSLWGKLESEARRKRFLGGGRKGD